MGCPMVSRPSVFVVFLVRLWRRTMELLRHKAVVVCMSTCICGCKCGDAVVDAVVVASVAVSAGNVKIR